MSIHILWVACQLLMLYLSQVALFLIKLRDRRDCLFASSRPSLPASAPAPAGQGDVTAKGTCAPLLAGPFP